MIAYIHTFKTVLEKAHVRQTGMKQHYFYIPQEFSIFNKIFPDVTLPHDIEVIDSTDHEKFKFRIKLEKNEYRITNQVAQYIRKHNLNAGDEIFLYKKGFKDGSVEYSISNRINNESFILNYFQKLNSYTIDYNQRLTNVISSFPQECNFIYENRSYPIKIESMGEIKTRKDAKNKKFSYKLEGINDIPINSNSFILDHQSDYNFELKNIIDWSYSYIEMED